MVAVAHLCDLFLQYLISSSQEQVYFREGCIKPKTGCNLLKAFRHRSGIRHCLCAPKLLNFPQYTQSVDINSFCSDLYNPMWTSQIILSLISLAGRITSCPCSFLPPVPGAVTSRTKVRARMQLSGKVPVWQTEALGLIPGRGRRRRKMGREEKKQLSGAGVGG